MKKQKKLIMNESFSKLLINLSLLISKLIEEAKMTVYNKIFHDNQEKGSLDSARAVVPIVMNIINPKIVIDVGCGLGNWLLFLRN